MPKVLCKAIADNLSEIDSEHKAVYDANVSSYIGKLDELDAQYKSAVESSSKKDNSFLATDFLSDILLMIMD